MAGQPPLAGRPSRRTIGARIDRHILPVLGDRRLDHFARSPSIVSGWLAGFIAGPVYTRDILSTLSAILVPPLMTG